MINNENNTPKHFLEIAVMIVGLISSFSFVVSVVYDFGYYSSLNLEFADIPLTISDHIISSLNWIPFVLVLFALTLLLEMITWRLENGMTESEILLSTSNHEKTKKRRVLPSKVMFVFAIILLLTNIITGQFRLSVLLFSIPYIWIGLTIWITSNNNIIKRTHEYVRFIFVFMPAILIMIYFFGYGSALEKYRIGYNTSKIVLTSKGIPETVIVFRNYEKGILVKNNNNKIIFYPFIEIKTYETSGNKSNQIQMN